MKFTGTHFEAQPALSDAVSHFYCIQTPTDFETETGHLSPNMDMLLVFNFGAPVKISFAGEPFNNKEIKDVAAIGPLRRMLNYEVLPGSDVIVTVFNLDGFYRLFNTSMDEMDSEKITDPDTLLKKICCHDLWKVLKNTIQLKDRIQILSDYILSFIRASDDAAAPLLEGLSYFNNPLIQPAKAIAQDSKLSERTIQLRFKKFVGYTPKEMLRFLRFKQVLNSIRENPGKATDWFDIIHDFGYHDQSHLIKDFQHYIGTTPQNFIKQVNEQGFCVSKPGKYY